MPKTGTNWGALGKMTPTAVRLGLFAFVVLTGALATNVFILQPPHRQVASVEPGDGRTTAGAERQAAAVPPAPAAPSVGTDVPPLALETGAVHPLPETEDRTGLTRAIQRELKAKGYETGAVDGVVGLVTRGAIMAYESDANLPLSAEPRQALLQHIVLGSADIAPADRGRPGEPGPEAEAVIKGVQRAFRQLGYMTTLPSGRLNEETRRAIRKFETERNLRETGRISGELLARLATLAGDALRTAER